VKVWAKVYVETSRGWRKGCQHIRRPIVAEVTYKNHSTAYIIYISSAKLSSPASFDRRLLISYGRSLTPLNMWTHKKSPEQAESQKPSAHSLFYSVYAALLALLLLLSYHRYANERSMHTAGHQITGLAFNNTSMDGEKHEHAHSIFLPYTKPFTTASVPLVKTTIEGVTIDMPVDTGSTGLLVGAPLLPHLNLEQGTPTYQYLTSSKILYNGRLVNLTVTFHGAGSSYAEAKVPVLVVDKSWTCPWYDPHKDTFDCPAGPDGKEPTPRDTSQITYMGVGFGRNQPGSGQPGAVPESNPFLNIESIDGKALNSGTRRAGWTISTEGVYVGLTKSNTHRFSFTKLERGVTHDEDPRDWAMVKMRFIVDGELGSPGYGLVDTGIAQMYIRAEEDFPIPTIHVKDPNGDGSDKEVVRVRPGTNISVGFPSLGGRNVASYSIVVGKQCLMAPSFVAPGKQTPPPFLNTGRTFLYGYSIAFDAVEGRFGFRPTGLIPISPQ
jgi:hypothetical protein